MYCQLNGVQVRFGNHPEFQSNHWDQNPQTNEVLALIFYGYSEQEVPRKLQKIENLILSISKTALSNSLSIDPKQ